MLFVFKCFKTMIRQFLLGIYGYFTKEVKFGLVIKHLLNNGHLPAEEVAEVLLVNRSHFCKSLIMLLSCGCIVAGVCMRTFVSFTYAGV